MGYREIDLKNFYRKAQYDYFMTNDSPLIEVTVNVEITEWYRAIKAQGKPFYLSFLYAVCRALNQVPAFRQRIVGDQIVEYDNCPAAYTVALANGSYSYCALDTDVSCEEFIATGRERQSAIEASMEYYAPEDGDRYFWFSSLPWLSFVHVNFPLQYKTYSSPTLVWGKYFDENTVQEKDGKIQIVPIKKIPLTIEVNHILVDGAHIQQFLEALDRELQSMCEEK